MPPMSDTDAQALAPETPAPLKPLTALEHAADLWGIEREFWDIWGKRHETPPETQKGVLKSLGVDTSSEEAIERALSDRQSREWSRPLAPTIVTGDGMPLEIAARIPAELESATATLEMRLENGITERFELPLGS